MKTILKIIILISPLVITLAVSVYFANFGNDIAPQSSDARLPESCSDFISQSDCDSISGCSWKPTTRFCRNLTTKNACTNRSGCSWNGCTGDSRQCASLSTETTCNNNVACGWGGGCSGTYISGGRCEETADSNPTPTPTNDPDDLSTNLACKYCENKYSNQARCMSRSSCNSSITNECNTASDCGSNTTRPICNSSNLGTSSDNFQCVVDQNGRYNWVDLSRLSMDGIYQAWLAVYNTNELQELLQIVENCQNQNCDSQNNCNTTTLGICLNSKNLPPSFVNSYVTSSGLRMQCGVFVRMIQQQQIDSIINHNRTDSAYQEKGWSSDWISVCNPTNTGTCTKTIRDNAGESHEYKLIDISKTNYIPQDGDILFSKRKDASCGWSNNSFNCDVTGHIAIVSREVDNCTATNNSRCLTVFDSNYFYDEQMGTRSVMPNFNQHDYYIIQVN